MIGLFSVGVILRVYTVSGEFAGGYRDFLWTVTLYEVFLAGCYDKTEEVDDSGANLSMFFEDLFISWIHARQKAGCPPEETVQSILSWMHNDNYGICYHIHGPVAKALNATAYRLFRSHFGR